MFFAHGVGEPLTGGTFQGLDHSTETFGDTVNPLGVPETGTEKRDVSRQIFERVVESAPPDEA